MNTSKLYCQYWNNHLQLKLDIIKNTFRGDQLMLNVNMRKYSNHGKPFQLKEFCKNGGYWHFFVGERPGGIFITFQTHEWGEPWWMDAYEELMEVMKLKIFS